MRASERRNGDQYEICGGAKKAAPACRNAARHTAAIAFIVYTAVASTTYLVMSLK